LLTATIFGAGAGGLGGLASRSLGSRSGVSADLTDPLPTGRAAVDAQTGRAGAAGEAVPSSSKAITTAATEDAAPARVPGPRADCITPNSFAGDTRVLMADGSSKPIAQVTVGDQVMASDPGTGMVEPQTVENHIVGAGRKQLVTITIDTDGNHGSATGTLVATSNHPFWDPDAKAWVDAGRLSPGEHLLTANAVAVSVAAVTRPHEAFATVYNLTIAATHTYYVLAGSTPVLVHNCGTEDFAHGTTLESGQNIVNNGLDRVASNANLVGSKAPGSFFTVPVNPADKMAALETAGSWGSRHGGETCVIVCRLPNNVVADLERQGWLTRTEAPLQAAFHPNAFPIVNRFAEWFGPIPVG
jgi:hypothetical protein